jgi:aspartate dehydrogenase
LAQPDSAKATTSAGIVGCGAIGRAILRASAAGTLSTPVAGVTSRTQASALAFLSTLERPPPLLDLPDLIDRCDLIVEAAGGHVVAELARQTFAAGKALMVISIGALLDHPEVFELARTSGCALLLPSGAIAGLDGVKAACRGDVDYVRLSSRKPPRALQGAAFLKQNGISLEGLTGPRLLYEGPAREAVRGFPDNLNVSAALSLAGIGPDRTQVSITVDPGIERNCHEIEVQGEFGLLRVHIENIPSENPKTGRLTALSIIRAIDEYFDAVRVGA